MTVDGGVDVTQVDAIRTVQGADGATLHTLAVDASGRLIMLTYGWDGATYRPVKVDDEGRMIGVMKGQADVKWGLRGWWKFVASEGTTIKDYSGYSNNGSALSGAAAEAKYEDGVIGQAIELDGVDDRISCSSTNYITDPPFTFEAWIYPHTQHVGTIISKGNVNTECGFILTVENNGAVGFHYYTGAARGVSWSTQTYNAMEWTHIIITVDADWNVKFYFNGVYDCTRASTGTSPFVNINALTLGRLSYAAVWFFDGLLDEVRMYGRVLSADEVGWRYANTNPAVGKPTRMIAVDSEGRMRINVEGLPYKTQVAARATDTIVAGGNANIQSVVCPEGKLWVLTSVVAYTDTAPCDSIDIGVAWGAINVIVDYLYAVGAASSVYNHGDLILKAGDRINAGFVGLPANGHIVLNILGYELDVY